MHSTSGRRELAFVVALAGIGLALVLIVAFVPWYPVTSEIGTWGQGVWTSP